MKLIVLHGKREVEVTVQRTGAAPDAVWEVTLGERTYRLDARLSRHGVGTHLLSLRLEGGRQHEVTVQRQAGAKGGVYRVTSGAVEARVEVVDPLTHLAGEARGQRGRAGPERITAYMPGRVVEVLVEEGAEVEAGQGVVVLEAMKMENEIQAEHAGTIRKIFVQAGQAVEGGDPLFEIE